MKMRLASIGIVLAGVAGVYVASPYVALWRLHDALRAGDVDAVQDAVDWNQVRATLKREAAARLGIAAPTQQIVDRGELPTFGASFMEGIASHAVDEIMTPEALCQAMQESAMAAEAGAAPAGGFDWGHFDGPRSFSAQLRLVNLGPIRLRLGLEGTQWKVIEVHLPGGPKSRT